MSEIGKRIDEIVNADLAVRLKAEGFRKSSRTFFRAAADHTAVVNIQASLHNEGNSGTFAINLGVYFPLFAQFGDRESATTLIKRAIERLPRGRARFESWATRYGLLTQGAGKV